MSKFKHVRHTKRAKENERTIKALGRRTYGCDFANDGCRHIVDYKLIDKWLKSKVGQNWDKVYSELCKKFNKDSYIGQESIEYAKWLVLCSRWSKFYLDKQNRLDYKNTR